MNKGDCPHFTQSRPPRAKPDLLNSNSMPYRLSWRLGVSALTWRHGLGLSTLPPQLCSLNFAPSTEEQKTGRSELGFPPAARRAGAGRRIVKTQPLMLAGTLYLILVLGRPMVYPGAFDSLSIGEVFDGQNA